MTKPAPEPITPNFNVQTGLCLGPGSMVSLEKGAPTAARDDFMVDMLLNESKGIIAEVNRVGALPRCQNPAQMSGVSFTPKR